jgi:glucose/arabinose dehydrogenase
LIAVFLVAFFFLRGSGGGGGTGETTLPEAAGSTSTPAGGSSSTIAGSSSSTSLGSTSSTGDLGLLQAVRLETIAQDFQQPTVITAPVGDDRLFVAQRIGVIRILDAERQLLSPAFLDLSDRVVANGIEQGLLGLTFHPDYANNGRFFVYYTDAGGRRQLSEFQVSVSDPNIATPDSEKVLLELEQPENSVDIRHYAGQLAFGPDGYLWLSMGDGADSRAQAQNPNTFFGKVVRLDVDSSTEPYGIPPDNPFVSGGGLPEVWAYGLRNPWRFSIDSVDRLIYIGDVGHADLEEVDVLSIDEGGYNLGWSDMEGTRCFHKQDCDPADYTSPAITYSHSEGCSITGGYVYRGNEIPEFNGTYFYSDWCNQWIRSFKYVDGQVTEETDWTEDLGTIGQINSFGLGGDGEMYAVTYDGVVARFVADR